MPKDIEVVKALLRRPVAFHWALAMICENVHAGLMLSQAIYWSEQTEEHRWMVLQDTHRLVQVTVSGQA